MKLLRFGPKGQEKPGMLDAEGQIRDISSLVSDVGGSSLSESVTKLESANVASLPLVAEGTRLGPCLGNVGKLVCIGLNYTDHAKESNLAVPSEPIVFMKATSSLSGPNDPIELPRGSEKMDWEVELGIVIGKEAKYVEEGSALDYVAGYATFHDISERSFQAERGGQWTKGKSHDSFGPLGPYFVSKDEVPDPQALNLWLEVNGTRYQNGSTANMIFSVAHIVSYLSQFMSLQAGDVIATGTPAGVGMGQKPAFFLKKGDRVRLSVEGLGEQSQEVI